MTSKIVVNNIEADSGINTITFINEVTAPTFNGNITGTAATFTTGTFSGNVDIAGALTYEDVTNVDSVGIITARSGIHVTGGNVGIGTDNPGAKTHIDSTTSNTPLVVEASQTNRSRIVFRNNVETGTECNIELFDDDLRFVTNSGERLRITSNGKVGIDNTTPHRQLVVGDGGDISCFGANGGIYFGTSTGGFRNNGAIARAEQAGYHVSGSQVGDLVMAPEADKDLIFSSGSTNTMYERLRLKTGGNIGINDSGPNFHLDVNGNIALREGQVLTWHDGSGNKAGDIYMDSSDNFVIRNTSSVAERLRITSAGLMGVGTNSPATNLDVNGTIQLRAPSNSGGYTTYATRIYSRLDSTHCTVIESYLNNSTAFEMMGSYADGGGSNPRVVLAAGGQKVGINTNNPAESFHVNGTTRLGGGLDYGSTTILNIAPGVVKWDTSGVSGGRLNADQNGNWYLNNKSYPVYDSLGVNMNDIYGANSAANNIGGWVYLGSTQHSAPYPRKAYKISAPNANQGTFVYQVWFNGDANYEWGGLYEIRINNWSESSRFTSVAVTCINGDSDGLRVYAYNNSNGIWVTVNAIWGSLYIRKFGYDDGQRSRGSSLCAVDNGAYLAQADVNGTSGTIPSGYTEVHANDSGGGGYDIENNHRFQAGQGSP